ncbi:hypothetical protein C8R47DRAFT_965641 [Mycena vitilis]|nr:hypothetical protein C8R47DRAFT_965641 [Mycena vitilis]
MRPLFLVALALPALAAQVSISSRTLVDALSADPDYTSLITLLQRARLIPTLNRLNGSTFFAPTNDAIARHALWNYAATDGTSKFSDNIKEQLRQQLFYHLINYSLPAMPDAPHPQVLQTLHFPRTPLQPPTPAPPPSPPWMPIPGGSLGGAPQRLRVAARDQGAWVGVDAFGKGGVEIVKGKIDAGNGVLLGIDGVLEPPPDLAHIVSQHSSVSYFNKILTPEITAFLNTSELTMFLPVNDAFESLHELERLYLESEFAAADLTRIVNAHAVVQNKVKWSDSFEPSAKLKTIDGSILEVVVTPERTTVSSAELLKPDIYASNGVLHLVSSLLVDLEITPEKYLLALNCTSFVSLLHSVDLAGLVNDTDAKYTILAPRDDVLTLFGDSDIPEKGSEDLKKLLQYHFIPGIWTPKKLEDGMLLETALAEDGLDGGRQVLNIGVTSDKKKEDKSIKFGGVGVSDDPITINNTLIYFISRPLVPPSDALEAVLPKQDLSLFLASVYSAGIADTLKSTPKTSLLVPHNSAFKRLGDLVSTHLLAPASKKDLASVLYHHTLDTVEYARSIQNGSRTFATLEGSDVQLEHLKNGSVFISASGGWAGMRAELFPTNILTQTGVLHEVSDILIPRTVELTVGKLIKAADATTMATLVTKAGMDWVLNGTAPPPDSIWAEQGANAIGWTLLCPSDDAFDPYNLTQLYADLEGVRDIVSQHLIPTPMSASDVDILNNNRPLPLEDSASYSTLRSPSSAYGDIIFRRTDTNDFIVGIKGARGTDGDADWAHVVSWGRSTTSGGTGGVIKIDRLLVPYYPPWWVKYGGPAAVGVGGMVLICLFFYGVRAFWRRDFTQPTYEPSNATPAEQPKVSATEQIKSFIAGGFGGVAAVLVGHPFDLTKTRLQTAPAGVYTGAVDVVKKTIAKDGVTGHGLSRLYRGMIPPLLGVTPIFAISFWAYGASKQIILAATPNRPSDVLSIPELAAAGFMSAIPSTLVTAPVERAKVLLQVQGQGGSEHKYTGVFDVMKHLYKEGGMKSIFRGAGATLARDGPGSAAYFAAYEVTKKALTPVGSSPSELNLGAIIMAGGTAGVAMWAVAIPPDASFSNEFESVLKSRLQSAPTGTYSGLMDCARKTIAQDGVKALWKGFGPAMGRAFPANAATFVRFEARRKGLDIVFSSQSNPRIHRIARSLKTFDIWGTHQNLEQVSYLDIPADIKDDVTQVFAIIPRLPAFWVDPVVPFKSSQHLFMNIEHHRQNPSLFGEIAKSKIPGLFPKMVAVHSAWRRLKMMRESKEKYSEADFAANVYNVFRSPAIRESTHRVHCAISLPQPLVTTNLGPESLRILATKAASPDCVVLCPAASLRAMSLSLKSPFQVLNRHKDVVKSGSATKCSSFRYQSTPCAVPPETPAFQFVSSIWEDKKPMHAMLEDAYRQNRMATTAAARHLHSLHVNAPVFGLVWASGTVRAHVDWCRAPEPDKKKPPVVFSAPYRKEGAEDGSGGADIFHEWQLDRAADIAEVSFLIEEIDNWTMDGFRKRAISGVESLVESVVNKREAYIPWRRVGDLKSSSASAKENSTVISASTTTSAQSTPPQQKIRSRRHKYSKA